MNKLLLTIGRLLAVNEQTLIDTAKKVREVLNNIVGPIMIAIGSMGALYMVILGVQFAKAEGDDKRATIKKRLVNVLIGVVAIAILVTFLYVIKWEKFISDIFPYGK